MRQFLFFSFTSVYALTLLLSAPAAFAQWGEDDDDSDEIEDDEEGDEDEEEDPGEDEDEDDSDASDESDSGEGKDSEGSREGIASETDGLDSVKAPSDKASTETADECQGPNCPNKAKANSGRTVNVAVVEEEESLPVDTQVQPNDVDINEKRNDEAARAAYPNLPEGGPSLSPLKVSTSTFSRLELREGYDSLGVETERRREGDAVFFRARLGIETNPLPLADRSNVSVKFSPQAIGNWGSTSTVEHPSLGLYEGYMRIRSERLDAYVGRQMMVYGDGIIFGEVYWPEFGRAFDGLKFHYKMNKGYVDMFALQTAEVHPAGEERLFGGDQFIWGAYSGFGGYLGDEIEVDAYLIGRTTVAQDAFLDPLTSDIVNAEGGTLFTAGARVKHRVDWFDYRFEAGVQFGERARGIRTSATTLASTAAFAYQGTAEIGFWLGEATRLALGGDYASGDDLATRGAEGWDPLYPTFWGWLGYMDVIGLRTNVASGTVKLRRQITSDLTLDIDGFVFARPEFGGLGQVGEQKMAGVELDTRLQHRLGKYALARGTYGLFIPSTGHYVSDDLASFGEVEIRLEF